MITFWLLAFILFAITIAFTLYPFLFKPETGKSGVQTDIDQKQINIDIAKEQLVILEDNFNSGEISREEYDSLKYELESSLIDDLSAEETQDSNNSPSDLATSASGRKLIMALIIVFIPLCSVLLYQQLGSPGLIDASVSAPQTAETMQHDSNSGGNQRSIDEMIGSLADHLKANPGDEKGWQLLARTSMTVKKYDMAYDAYAALLSIKGEDPAILVSMADALAMARGGKVSGEPEKLLKRALELSPDDMIALWLLGNAEKEKGNQQQALTYWNKLYLLVTDAGDKQRVAQLIQSVGGSAPDSADSTSGKAPTATLADESTDQPVQNSIEVTIDLAPELASQTDSGDMVFIYAKALQGPPMPLAAVKKKVSDLPVTVTLDDSMAMMATMKISQFDQVKVGARVSKSGQPVKQPGDLMSDEIQVDLENIQPVKLNINTIVK